MKFAWNINTIFISLLFLFLAGGVASYYLREKDIYELPTGALPVPIQVGKNKIIVSKTGDASMATEGRRRRAVISNHKYSKNFNFKDKSSTNGSLEAYFLSAVCPPFQPVFIYDGGNAESEFCYVLDGNGDIYIVDGGYADTNVCSV